MAVPYQDLSPVELDELLSAILPDVPGHRVLRLLGRGGMSYVYLGVQEDLDRQVAVKVMSPLALEDEVSRQRFEKEARTIAKLQHPSIVGIHAVGRTELGLSYYVMPYLSRGHLGQRDLRRDEVQIMGILRSLLGALDYAHAQGVVHRDVKAENVLFDHDDRPHLTDFGIAITKRDRSRMTGSGNAVGSWAYMAPEQARGEQVDGRADLYSVGVLTYEMLTGQLPFHDEDTMALALMHALDPVPRLPQGKAHWQALIDRAMAKTPDARYQTAREMLADLDRIALQAPASHPKKAAAASGDRASEVAPRQPGERSGRGLAALARLPRWAWGALGAVLLAVLVLAMWPSSPKDGVAPAVAESRPLDAAAPPAAAPVPPSPVARTAEPDPITAQAGDPVTTESADPAEAGELSPDALEEGVADADEFEIPDDLPPGEAELLIAEEQIRRRRLTQPRGESALDALLEARQKLGDDRRVTNLAARWVSAMQPYAINALERDEDDRAMALLDAARRLNEALDLTQTEAWTGLLAAMAEPVHAQLRKAHADKDLAALRAARARAGTLGIESSRLEPEYSKAIVTARPGDLLNKGGTGMALVRLPGTGKPGLAVLPTPVTRKQYGDFAQASGRGAAQCRIRTANVTVRKRSWQDPGFEQAGGHPVVCVSVADAQAYASWLGQRDGVSYRLPTEAEWRAATGAAAGASCGQAGVQCRDGGTRDAVDGPRLGNGVHSSLGNVREWPAGCADCREKTLLGLSWRDGSATRRVETVEATRGYDDIGFRLVRDVAREEVEQR